MSIVFVIILPQTLLVLSLASVVAFDSTSRTDP